MHPNNVATGLQTLGEEILECAEQLQSCSNKDTYTQHTILKDLKCKSCLWSFKKIHVNKIEKGLQLIERWSGGWMSHWGNQHFRRDYEQVWVYGGVPWGSPNLSDCLTTHHSIVLLSTIGPPPWVLGFSQDWTQAETEVGCDRRRAHTDC